MQTGFDDTNAVSRHFSATFVRRSHVLCLTLSNALETDVKAMLRSQSTPLTSISSSISLISIRVACSVALSSTELCRCANALWQHIVSSNCHCSALHCNVRSAMLSGELASRAAKLKREQQQRTQRNQQKTQAEQDAERRQQERLRAVEEEGRQRRLTEIARQDELRLQARRLFLCGDHGHLSFAPPAVASTVLQQLLYDSCPHITSL